MFKTEIRKKLALIAALLTLTTAFTSCGTDEESSVSTDTSSSVAETTEALTEEETEDTKETETEAETEETTEAETEEETTETEETSENVETGESVSKIEIIKMINEAFGMYMTDTSDEGQIDTAITWDIISDKSDMDGEATPEFLISAAMRATGIVTGESSLDEIINCAVQNGVIAESDISAISLDDAADIIDKAVYAWTHRSFSNNEITVELVEGVIDLNETAISVEDIEINDNTIKIPAKYAENIEAGTVYILPKNSETGEGGAYKAESVEIEDDIAVIKSVPAEIEEVYKSISSN